MSADKLVRMANQIATFFEVQPSDRAVSVAAHINENWSPAMRDELLRHIAAGGEGLDPLVLKAAEMIRPMAGA